MEEDFEKNWDIHAEKQIRDEPTSRGPSDMIKEILIKMEACELPCKVLDAGCGIGAYINTFLDMGCEVCGIDGSPGMTKEASMRFPDIEIYRANLRDIEFNDEFDLIFSHAVLQHISPSNKLRVLLRYHKALKKDGFLMLMEETFTPSNVGDMERHGFLAKFFEDYSNGGGYTVSGWIRLVQAFGFEIQLYEKIPNNLEHVYLFKRY